MDRYQEAYLKLLSTFNNMQLGINAHNTLEITQHFDTLQELVEQTKVPTLEECIKEWEDLGYEWIEKLYTDSIVLKKTVEEPWLGNDTHTITYFISISINVVDKTYRAEKRSCFACEGKVLTLQEHQLITKTIQALGGIKNGF